MQKDVKKIIILEQDQARKNSLKTVLSQEGYLVFSFDAIDSCLDNIDLLDADLMILGGMRSGDVIPILNALMAVQSRLPLLLISDEENLRHLLETNQCNHAAIVDSTFDLVMFRAAVQAALEKGDKPGGMDFTSYLVGSSPELLNIKGKLSDLGRLNESILITGEPGAGKEAVARAIHGASNRDAACFIKIDASELNGGTRFSLLSALKGNVPDLVMNEKILVNERWEQWTIYLDEICALPDYLQAELLLITGADNGHSRILAGTSSDMGGLVKAGRFRKDLFYRLNVFHMKIPALRHRKTDIPLLTDFFLYKFCREFDKVFLPVSSRLKEMFMQYDWPGNVRELQDMVKRALLKGEQHIAFSNHLKEPLRHGFQNRLKRVSKNQIHQSWTQELDSIEQLTNEKEYLGQVGEKALKNITWDFMATVEKRVMKRALESTNWNRKKAAVMLDISYKSMLNKIKEYELA
jgi:DNA-binding NtrC family response regulator